MHMPGLTSAVLCEEAAPVFDFWGMHATYRMNPCAYSDFKV